MSLSNLLDYLKGRLSEIQYRIGTVDVLVTPLVYWELVGKETELTSIIKIIEKEVKD